jgi:hypothetical protein
VERINEWIDGRGVQSELTKLSSELSSNMEPKFDSHAFGNTLQ